MNETSIREQSGLLNTPRAPGRRSLLTRIIGKKRQPVNKPLSNTPESIELKIQNGHFHDPGNVQVERVRWSNYMEYFLSIIGFVIDLGNVWRFPTICYQNGGGAFLIPWAICLFLIGMPSMYLELAIGQYFQAGNITLWGKISPYLKGLGYSVIIINIYIQSYYNTLQAYALYYLSHSFQSPVPWSRCDQEWNTPHCINKHIIHDNYSLGLNGSLVEVYSSTSEFFNRRLLARHESHGFDDLAGVRPGLLLCLFAILFVATACLINGIKTSGKAIYVTALLPYVCLAVLMVQSLSLDGSWDGLNYYLTPNFGKLFTLDVWLAAAVQIFFSLGPGFGVLIAYSSYTPRNTNIQTLTILCSLVNCATSFLYGVVVFAGIGYMAKRLDVGIDHFLKDGSALVWVIYPEIIATFKNASLFSAVFFTMLISLGMDSTFGGLEGLYTSLVDEYPTLKRYGVLTRCAISLVPFLTSLPTITYAGMYVVQWLDRYAVSPSVLVIVFCEVVIISWYYGLDKFCLNIKEMNKRRPLLNWRLSWKYICPLSLIGIVVLDAMSYSRFIHGDYVYPNWSNVVGYGLNVVALLPLFIYPLVKFIVNRLRRRRSR